MIDISAAIARVGDTAVLGGREVDMHEYTKIVLESIPSIFNVAPTAIAAAIVGGSGLCPVRLYKVVGHGFCVNNARLFYPPAFNVPVATWNLMGEWEYKEYSPPDWNTFIAISDVTYLVWQLFRLEQCCGCLEMAFIKAGRPNNYLPYCQTCHHKHIAQLLV